MRKFLHGILARRNQKRLDSGFTATEIMVVLLVIAILIGATMMGYQAFQTGGKASAVNIQVGRLITSANNYAQSIAGNPYGPYYGIGTYAAQGYNGGANALLPSAYTSSGISNAFGGVGTISAGSSNYTFTITETGLPSDVCQHLYTSYQAHALSGGCSGSTLTLVMQ